MKTYKIGIALVFLLINTYIGFAIGNKTFNIEMWSDSTASMWGFCWVSLCIIAVLVKAIEQDQTINP